VNIIKSTRKDILEAVEKAAGIISGKSTMPILTNLMIRKTAEGHEFIGSDIDIEIHAHAQLGGDEGSATTSVPAAKLLSLLKSLPTDQVVTLTLDQGKVLMKAGRSKFTLQTMDARDFPMFRQEGATMMGSFEVSQPALASLIDQTHYAMADNLTQPHYCGMFVELTGSRLSAVASDGKRLAVSREVLATTDNGLQEAIIPRKTVLELRKLLDGEGPVHVTLKNNHAKFEFGNIIYLSRLVSGKYVPYERALSMAGKDHCVKVGRPALLAVLKRAQLVLDDKVKSVRFTFAPGSPGTLTVHGTSMNRTEDGEQELDIDYDGDNVTIGLPVAQVIDGLVNFTDDLVSIHFTNGDKPVMLTYESLPTFQYLISPMRI